VKALRLYHDKGLLVPHTVDESSGYRYYSSEDITKARLIRQLRDMEVSIADIQTIIECGEEDKLTLETLEKHRNALQEKIQRYDTIAKSIHHYIIQEQEAGRIMSETSQNVEVKQVCEMIIAGKRYTGKYSDCGPVFGELCRKTGWLAAGTPFNLYYDGEYKEDDAEIECCIPLKKEKEIQGLDVRTIPGGQCISLLYKGPYEEIHRAYEKVMKYANENSVNWKLPIREIYHKGPGMIFRGNPNKYLTEIQLMIEE
jgi:DNA-binding transcriptional MerR regulator/effector-binding domain-containing protein